MKRVPLCEAPPWVLCLTEAGRSFINTGCCDDPEDVGMWYVLDASTCEKKMIADETILVSWEELEPELLRHAKETWEAFEVRLD